MAHRSATTTPDASSRDVEAVSRYTTIAQWSVASVVMAGSAVAGGFTFYHLGEPPALGVVTALGVDAALAAWLLISRFLRSVGVRSTMGHVLEVTAAVMTLYLNIGSAVFVGIPHDSSTAKALLGIAHSFLPVVLVLVSLAGGQAQYELLKLRRIKAAEENAAKERQLREDRAAYESEQRVAKIAKTEETARLERIRQDTVRLKERELDDRLEERALRDKQIAANLAGALSIGAVLRARPARRTRAVPRERPAVSRAPSQPRRPSVPVTNDLLTRAQTLRTERASQNKTAGRTVFERELGVSERTAKELVRRLGPARPAMGLVDPVEEEAARLFAEMSNVPNGAVSANGHATTNGGG